MALNAKQKAFCHEYVVDLNATQAAIRAGYSPKTAVKIASKLLTKADIQELVQTFIKAREVRTTITQDMVIEGLLKEAQDEDNGSPTARVSAWEKLGKHLGIFEKDNSQKVVREITLSRKRRDRD